MKQNPPNKQNTRANLSDMSAVIRITTRKSNNGVLSS